MDRNSPASSIWPSQAVWPRNQQALNPAEVVSSVWGTQLLMYECNCLDSECSQRPTCFQPGPGLCPQGVAVWSWWNSRGMGLRGDLQVFGCLHQRGLQCPDSSLSLASWPRAEWFCCALGSPIVTGLGGNTVPCFLAVSSYNVFDNQPTRNLSSVCSSRCLQSQNCFYNSTKT